MHLYVRLLFSRSIANTCVQRKNPQIGALLWQHFRTERRHMATFPGSKLKLEDEPIKVGHSRFIAEAGQEDKWKDGVGNPGKGGEEAVDEEVNGLKDGQGKLLPTSSNLLKLILPLAFASLPSAKPHPYTVFILHPSQPLSHLARLISSSLRPDTHPPAISFRSKIEEGEAEWSDSTDLGDFIKSVVAEEHFSIVFTPCGETPESSDLDTVFSTTKDTEDSELQGTGDRVITVKIPSYKDRTRFLRRKLNVIAGMLRQMEKLKRECDVEAHRGARRMAVGGFGMLLVYWLGVARLTFYDYGWDVMEPITYLSGLSSVICGYLWFLYKGREVSYSSVLDQSVSTRRNALYKSRGFDIERWVGLVTEQKALKGEMKKIAEDYDILWDGSETDEERDSPEGPESDTKMFKKKLNRKRNGKEGKEESMVHPAREGDEGDVKLLDKLQKKAREDQERSS